MCRAGARGLKRNGFEESVTYLGSRRGSLVGGTESYSSRRCVPSPARATNACRAAERARHVEARSHRERALPPPKRAIAYSGIVEELVAGGYERSRRGVAGLRSASHALRRGPAGPWALLNLSEELAQGHAKRAGELVRDVE